MKRLSFVLVLILLATASVDAQKFPKRYKYTSVGITANAMNYVGDLDPAPNPFSPALRFTRWQFGGVLVHRFSPRMHARGAFSYGRIQGDDAKSSTTVGDDIYRNRRNLNFKNDIYELKADLIWDVFANRRGLQRRLQYTPYVFLGVAGFYHNPKNNEGVALRALGTEGQYIDGVGQDKPYSLIQVAVPFGVGFRYKLTSSWDVAFEIGWRMTFTDYLDDVGGDYIDKQNFEYGSTAYWASDRSITPEQAAQYSADPSSAPGNVYSEPGDDGNQHWYMYGYGKNNNGTENRGDKGFDNDWYIVTGIHLMYIFHPKVVCPKFRG